MKRSKVCPKCQSTDIIRIEGRYYGYGAGNIIYFSAFRYVKVSRYLCGRCGYVEEWIDDPADIERLKNKFKRAKHLI